MFGQQRGSIPCTQEERRESLSSKGAQSGLAVPLPFPWKERTGCLWTCRGGNGLFPVPGSGHGPSCRKRGRQPSAVKEGGCGGGCLGGEGDRFSSYLGRSPLKGATRFGDTISAFSEKGGGAFPGAMGNGGSSPGGRQQDKRVWRRRSPFPRKKGGSALTTRRAEGPSLLTPGPAAGDPLRGAGGCFRQTGRGDHRLFNGGRSVSAPGAAGDGKNRSANHRPGGGVPAVRPCATPSRTPFSAYPSPFSPPVQLCHRLKGVYRGVFSLGLSPSAQIFAFCIQTPCIWWHNSHSGTPPPTLRGGW